MNSVDWYARRNDRTIRYAGRVLDPDRHVFVHVDSDYARSYAGQVATLTACNLLSRMTPHITVNVGLVPTDRRLRWMGDTLGDAALATMEQADPHGRFQLGATNKADFTITLGPKGPGRCAFGEDWNSGIGVRPAHRSANVDNPMGATLAAILAVSELFVRNGDVTNVPIRMNAFNWHNDWTQRDDFVLPRNLGEIWVVGTGSVGSATLFFLSMLTADFSTALFDMDIVKVENLDRSPIFRDSDVGSLKVASVGDFLRQAGLQQVREVDSALDESILWRDRTAGTPDILLSCANERNVRYLIESSCPPIQIYGTTGGNWQASVLRHTPLTPGCSCCVFPPERPTRTMCATAEVSVGPDSEHRPDVALPFLSFLAGLMAAAEICKLGLPGYPFSADRVTLNTRPSPRLIACNNPVKPNCCCTHRSPAVHRTMIAGGRYAHLSPLKK